MERTFHEEPDITVSATTDIKMPDSSEELEPISRMLLELMEEFGRTEKRSAFFIVE